MKSQLTGGASVIGIGSMSSYFGIGIVPGYGAGKTGLLGITRALAVEWGRTGFAPTRWRSDCARAA